MSKNNIDQLDPKEFILIKGARQHNLKNIDVAIPRNTFTVITGVSGSGKSTLAFDTLYAEGQRRYVESLSSYARQFLARLEKPEVDYIKGISPAIAIEQKVVSKNSRSTVASSTEINDYLKVLFARLGKIVSPITGKEVKREYADDVYESLLAYSGVRGVVFVPSSKLVFASKEDLMAEGFSRVRQDGVFARLEDLKEGKEFDLVIDRFKISEDEDFRASFIDSVDVAFGQSDGYCWVDVFEGEEIKTIQFSQYIEENNVRYEEPNVNLLSHNSPTGACPTCEGFGQVLGISEDLVINDPNLSVYEGAVAPWRTKNQVKWKYNFIKAAAAYDFPIHTAYKKLNPTDKKLLWEGAVGVKGIRAFFDHKQKKIYKIQNRVLLSRYKGRTTCPDCKGQRLRKEALCIKVGEKNIADVCEMSIEAALDWVESLKFNKQELLVAERLLDEIKSRLLFLVDVGVPYITLDRSSNTLSGGESQRINLASSLGSALVGALYVLDEPSIGLHPKDTAKLIKVLKGLNKKGNTVLVVEHDADIMNACDYMVDIGPKAGALGGEVVFQGAFKDLNAAKSLTAAYLKREKLVQREGMGSKGGKELVLKSMTKHNLKIDELCFPLNQLVVITGVSGSGKSTLLKEELIPRMKNYLAAQDEPLLDGDLTLIDALEYVDQNPIGRSSRSNPITYIKAYDDIRSLFSALPMSKLRGYKPGFFSLNVSGGRCENCQGEGAVNVEMQFMADIQIKCTECDGKKFKEELLEVQYQGLSIYDVLNLTVGEALSLFKEQAEGKKRTVEEKIVVKLQALVDVGLSYIKLGQSSSTLSGGEAQRVKLAYFLIKGNSNKKTLFLFDEPTTGLHFEDVNQLLVSFDMLLKQGHSIVVIEHNMELAKTADYIVELGPEGGEKGGNLTFSGKASRFFKQ